MFDAILVCLDGYKTYISASGLLILSLFQMAENDFSHGLQSLLAAMTAASLRHAVGKKPKKYSDLSPMPDVGHRNLSATLPET